MEIRVFKELDEVELVNAAVQRAGIQLYILKNICRHHCGGVAAGLGCGRDRQHQGRKGVNQNPGEGFHGYLLWDFSSSSFGRSSAKRPKA